MENEKRTTEAESLPEDPAAEAAPAAPAAEARPEFSGRNLEEAISLAEHRLKTTRDRFNYEIVTEKTKLFGIGTREIVIRAWPKREDDEAAVENFLRKMAPHFLLDISWQIKKRDGLVYVIFDGPDRAFLLRNDGQLLLALQHILNKISDVKVQVDCDFFRKRKEKDLREFAQRAAQKVRESGREEILEAMNPYERRIVHIAVNEIRGVTTESLGEGFLKRVRVMAVSAPGRRTTNGTREA